jgi:multidrug efflux pump
LDVIKAIREQVPGHSQALPAAWKWAFPTCATKYIQDALEEVLRTLIETLAIVVVVIFLFPAPGVP